jgi:hypothetical protein
MDHKDLYCQSVGWSKVCRDRFGTECGAVNTQQQERLRMFNVTLRRFPVTITAVEKQFELRTLCMCL